MSRIAKWLVGLAILAALSVPFVLWYQTWFGRPLTDGEIARDLAPDAPPRDTQHALTQLASAGTANWIPQIAALSHHPNAPIRAMAAWVMGQNGQAQLFHPALLEALHDPDLLVRRNAALALVRFRDSSGRPELRTILESEHDEQQIWEALRGLYLIGLPEDLTAVDKHLRDSSAAIRAQALQTAASIRRNAGMLATRR